MNIVLCLLHFVFPRNKHYYLLFYYLLLFIIIASNNLFTAVTSQSLQLPTNIYVALQSYRLQEMHPVSISMLPYAYYGYNV